MKKLYYYFSAILLTAVSFIFDKAILQFFVLIKNSFLDSFFILAGSLENSLIIFFIILIISELLYLLENKKLDLKIFLALVSTVLATYLIKFVAGRQRPNGLDSSFPSGHTSLSFAPIVFLKRFKILWIILACYIALSRVYLGQHYLSDVIAGAVIGYGIGDLIRWLKY